ncbi:MAG: 4'-phosphopantetheinyl transferase family protein [Lawsonibacter sp.]|jgi:4'-phosphopantetheinyl transferase
MGACSIFFSPFLESSPSDLSHQLLRQAAQRYSGLPSISFSHVGTNPWGKPFFPDAPNLHFSISHSGTWWVCGFADAPLGLDIQLHQTSFDLKKLAQRFFHPLEVHWLTQRNSQSFFDLWCAKESWVKFTGRGFFLDPSEFSVVSPQGIFPTSPQGQMRLLSFSAGYSACLCTVQIDTVQWIML